MPAGTIETRSTFGGLIRGVEAQFMDVYDQTVSDYKAGYTNLFEVRSSTKERERFTGVAGPGNLVKKDEGDNFTRAARIKTYNTEFIPVTYGKAIEATMEEIEDQDFKEKLNAAKHLTRRGLTTKEKHVYQVFNDAFRTTDSLAGFPTMRYGDGVPMASPIHPRRDGGTAQSNASATGIPLTESNVNVARLAILAQLEDDGTPIDTTGKFLILTSPALEKTAMEIIKSDYRSGTANNDINFYKGANFDVAVSKYLGAAQGGSDTQWFLLMPEMTKLLVIDRKSLEARTSVDEDNLNVKYTVNARWAAGYWDWRGIWGSKGDGAAYSA